MVQGYGVSEVIYQLSLQLQRLGQSVTILAEEFDQTFKHVDVLRIKSKSDERLYQIQALDPDIVCAHTSPYFEVLTEYRHFAKTLIYEHGDPTPELFEFDGRERSQIIENKKRAYREADGVIAISEFIKHEIDCPDALVIYNGCNHVPDLGKKDFTRYYPSDKLRVGMLSRFGEGENYYKNTKIAVELAKIDGVEVHVAGRGSEKDSEFFRDQGIRITRNLSDSEKITFLRSVDVLVSPSLWEGFNLPIVEAQALGTMAIAFDTGAHPETTPFIVDNIAGLDSLLQSLRVDRELLGKFSSKSYDFVHKKFSWDYAGLEFFRFINTLTTNSESPHTSYPQPFKPSVPRRLINLVTSKGYAGTVCYLLKKLRN
jgi:glycosyltransferase involved in cell wall biosynthesis